MRSRLLLDAAGASLHAESTSRPRLYGPAQAYAQVGASLGDPVSEWRESHRWSLGLLPSRVQLPDIRRLGSFRIRTTRARARRIRGATRRPLRAGWHTPRFQPRASGHTALDPAR